MIQVDVSDEEKEKCYQFASKIIGGGNQYNRFGQDSQTQIHRTYIGKLAEYIFLHFLQSRGIDVDEADMFEIWDGPENADDFDFILPNGESIDIKTASLSFHERIMVPIDQFQHRKDYYVGIKLHFETTNRGRTIIPESITRATICGFTTREILEKRPIENFNEGDCKAYQLRLLTDIEELIPLFDEP